MTKREFSTSSECNECSSFHSSDSGSMEERSGVKRFATPRLTHPSGDADLAHVADRVLLSVDLGADPSPAAPGLDHGVGRRGRDLVIVRVRLAVRLLTCHDLLAFFLHAHTNKKKSTEDIIGRVFHPPGEAPLRTHKTIVCFQGRSSHFDVSRGHKKAA